MAVKTDEFRQEVEARMKKYLATAGYASEGTADGVRELVRRVLNIEEPDAKE